MNKPAFSWIQSNFAQHLVSRCMGFLADRAYGPVTHSAIRAFIKHYGVNMQEAVQEDYQAYRTFNEFFTRPLKPHLRPIASTADAIVSPVDGCVSEIGIIQSDQIFQAKNCYYSVAGLLGGTNYADIFSQGYFLTAYLAPKDYHRIHMPIDGRLLEMTHVPGRLFSVNAAAVQTIPQLFARNERVVCMFDTTVGPVAVVMVGAMIVGSIATTWHGVVTPPTQRTITVWNYREENKKFNRGDEIGHFRLGSTVILLFPPNALRWDENYRANSRLHFGEKIAVAIQDK